MFNENLLKLLREKNDPSLSRVVDLLSLLHERSKELVPDYPNATHDSFSYLHALTSSLEGTNKANKDCHKFIEALCQKFNMSKDECYNFWKYIYENSNGNKIPL